MLDQILKELFLFLLNEVKNELSEWRNNFGMFSIIKG